MKKLKGPSSVADELYKALEDADLQSGLRRSVSNSIPLVKRALSNYPYLIELSERVRKVKDHILADLEYYIDLVIKNIERNRAIPHFAKTKEDALKLVKELVGTNKVVVKAKSMVTEEIGLREFLLSLRNDVWETDLGELLVQLEEGRPMHVIAPSIHITETRAAKLLSKVGFKGEARAEEMLEFIRSFLRKKFIEADVGISGANSIAADSGALVLVENEGNIRNSTNLPRLYISFIGVEKIMPTLQDALSQALVQAGYTGSFPPTYISVITGPSSTGDIEYKKLYGVHGPKEMHVVLYDGGRLEALKRGLFAEQLRCVRCGRCQIECPIWQAAGNIWGGRTYGGPMGVIWTAITQGVSVAAPYSFFCLGCGRCREVCPMDIDIPRMMWELRKIFQRSI